jgi:RNA polymerase sigma-70 factor (ECF subfamily)
MNANSTVDDEQWRALLPALRRFALSLTRDPSSADDLVQACAERALTRWESRDPSASLKSWLFAILYRHFLDSHRRATRLKRLMQLFTVDENFEPSAEQSLVASASLATFSRLSEDHRAILLMITIEGLSYQEAAQVLGIAPGTVMSRLSRARHAYRELVEGAPVTRLRRVK